MSKSPITCHVLDSVLGKPGSGIGVRLYQLGSSDDPLALPLLASGKTDADGRCSDLLPPGKLEKGTYKVCFDTGAYFAQAGRECFYPVVEITFFLNNPEEHYHIPLLLSSYTYTTYRGS
ncbi:Hydroxyisourate hydrolase [Dacryopinax primogenitus]|uniref:5-hydroxyisourate hydrolase n=1 Tax=Dacryopinax primogenitus (strain DJM 731) TaxID=1858805 RepID=M5G9V6_DACPD|nr:Hydroxyisourate hydrolase [Dacryopinax primogenitus]EJU02662.1 Hydroxyisourate hydrolase [Dacryopinax primogenitus]